MGAEDSRRFVTGPAECRQGHPLRYPNVQIRGTVNTTRWVCRTCGEGYEERLDGVSWYTQEQPF